MRTSQSKGGPSSWSSPGAADSVPLGPLGTLERTSECVLRLPSTAAQSWQGPFIPSGVTKWFPTATLVVEAGGPWGRRQGLQRLSLKQTLSGYTVCPLVAMATAEDEGGSRGSEVGHQGNLQHNMEAFKTLRRSVRARLKTFQEVFSC